MTNIPKVDIPEGQSGDWSVEKFKVTKEEAERFNVRETIQALQGREAAYIEPGKYTRLRHHGSVVMSDTPSELRKLQTFVYEVRGQVLITGLGLGVALNAALLKPQVKHVTVIELAQEVIELVGEHYKDKFGDKLCVIQANALQWRAPKGERYDVVWHDIWDAICTDNLPQMTKLRMKYGRRSGWQGCWAESTCKRSKRKGY